MKLNRKLMQAIAFTIASVVVAIASVTGAETRRVR